MTLTIDDYVLLLLVDKYFVLLFSFMRSPLPLAQMLSITT